MYTLASAPPAKNDSQFIFQEPPKDYQLTNEQYRKIYKREPTPESYYKKVYGDFLKRTAQPGFYR